MVVNYAQNVDAAEKVVSRIHANGGEAIAVRGDVSLPEDVEHIFAAADRIRRGAADAPVDLVEDQRQAGAVAGQAFAQGSTAEGTASAGKLEEVTVTARGEVVSVLPFFDSVTVEATAAASGEAFEPQGSP